MEEPTYSTHGFGDRVQQISHDFQALSTALGGAAHDVERYLTEHVQQNPVVTLAVAAGLGYVLAGGLRSRVNSLLLGMASRLVIAVAAREIGARIGAVHDPLQPRNVTSGNFQSRL